ncbi:DUF3231 family protein [Tuberibacillus sp. Marseille-P3662]|uniref:DUF3231 family protein n=1 Tax=Tuberibacillus sp. Marseille-P3662 TaxID=1965358 RepID=UPI000A1CD9A4|nr:DUF3231 family protein [Tuberibacillus sp. Marseille-P3662]
MTGTQPKLTSTEIAMLWTGYMNNSMSIQIMSYFLKTVEDPDIEPIVSQTLNMSTQNLNTITEFFNEAHITIPYGFSTQDVNLDAPKLYSDNFMLSYISNMAKVGILEYGLSKTFSPRQDIRAFFSQCLSSTSNLFDTCVETEQNKGLYIRAPYLWPQYGAEFIQGKGYLKGMNPFSDKRKINFIEISHVYANVQTNLIGMQLCRSFEQTTSSNEIKNYMKRGREISKKHIKIFSDTLLNDGIQSPITWDTAVTTSTISPFSDKLKMYIIGVLSASGKGNYSTAATASMRTDLILNYQRLSAEIGLYAKDGGKIMINNHWMEEPPEPIDLDNIPNRN